MTLLIIIALVGMFAIAWAVRRILHHFNNRIGTLESQMNVLLPPVR